MPVVSSATLFTVTMEPVDRLSALPTELQHTIISYLFANHTPDKTFIELAAKENNTKPKPTHHPLDCLAATSKPLRAEVNAWCRSFLIKNADITHSTKLLKTVASQAKAKVQPNFIHGKAGLVTWIKKHCVFCGKKSSRSAIFVNGLRCCDACDRKEWPDKITKTNARKEYDLSEEQLLPPMAQASQELLSKHANSVPRIIYGVYMSSNVPTTMFLRKDVEALAELVHGDLKKHLAKRDAKSKERQRKARQEAYRKECQELEAAAMATQSFHPDMFDILYPQPPPQEDQDSLATSEAEMDAFFAASSEMDEWDGVFGHGILDE